MSNTEFSLSEQMDYCFKSISSHITRIPEIIGKDSTILKMTKEEFVNWWNSVSHILKEHPEIPEPVEAIFMEAFLKFIHIKEQKNMEIKDDKNYFYRTLMYTAFNKIRKFKKNIRDISLETLRIFEVIEKPESVISEIDIYEILFREKALKKKGEFELTIREIATLFGYDIYNWQLKEVSDIYGENEKTVRSDHHRAKKTIGLFLKKYYPKEVAMRMESN